MGQSAYRISRARALGRGFSEFKRATDELKNTFEEETREYDLRRPPGNPGKLTPPGSMFDSYPAEANDDEEATAEEKNAAETRADQEPRAKDSETRKVETQDE